MNSLEMVTYMRKISFFFFVALGVSHFLFGSLAASGIVEKNALLASRVLYLPFLLASLSYAYTVIKEHLLINGKMSKIVDYVFLGIGIFALAGSLFVEFYFPDKPFA